jgi:hypothetical protein
MSATDCHIEFDGRLWDIRRMLRAGDVERARVESALLLADSEAACHDWVAEHLHELWEQQSAQRSA